MPRGVVQQLVFQGQRGRRELVDPGVDALAVGLQNFGGFGVLHHVAVDALSPPRAIPIRR